MRPLVYYVAASLDGFIAREDGSFAEFPWDDAYLAGLMDRYPETFPAPFRPEGVSRKDNKRFDAVLMGRKTYEVGLAEGLTSPYPTLDQYVFSRSLEATPAPNIQLVREDAPTFVAGLRATKGAAIWICGGSRLASSLLDAGLVDEIIVKLNPIVFGTGIPLLTRSHRSTSLKLEHTQSYDSGHVILSYSVSNAEAGVAEESS